MMALSHKSQSQRHTADAEDGMTDTTALAADGGMSSTIKATVVGRRPQLRHKQMTLPIGWSRISMDQDGERVDSSGMPSSQEPEPVTLTLMWTMLQSPMRRYEISFTQLFNHEICF